MRDFTKREKMILGSVVLQMAMDAEIKRDEDGKFAPGGSGSGGSQNEREEARKKARELMDKAAATKDPEEKTKLYREAQKHLEVINPVKTGAAPKERKKPSSSYTAVKFFNK